MTLRSEDWRGLTLRLAHEGDKGVLMDILPLGSLYLELLILRRSRKGRVAPSRVEEGVDETDERLTVGTVDVRPRIDPPSLRLCSPTVHRPDVYPVLGAPKVDVDTPCVLPTVGTHQWMA